MTIENGNGRRINPNAVVITYRAVVGVLLSVIGAMMWAMWQDVSSRQAMMGKDLQTMSTSLAGSNVMLMDHERRIGNLETHVQSTDGRIDAIELRGAK